MVNSVLSSVSLEAHSRGLPAPLATKVVIFGGFHRLYAISTKTRDEALPIMRRLLKGTESLRQEREIALQETFNANPSTSLPLIKPPPKEALCILDVPAHVDRNGIRFDLFHFHFATHEGSNA